MMKEPEEDMFKTRLREARSLRGMNQAQLAEKAQLPASSISHFEAGSRKPSFDNLRRLATVLNVTTDYLLGRTNDPALAMEADPLYRHAKKLSDEDRKLVANFMEMLSNKKKD